MARIRSVHPSICESETMAALPAEVERTFVRLWTHCDDYGKCLDNVRLIKAALFPLHDDVTLDLVNEHLDELAAAGVIRRYEVAGKRYIVVNAWGEFQHPQRPTVSKFPDPDDDPRGSVAEASSDAPCWSGVEKEIGEGVEATLPNDFQPSPGSLEWAESLGFTEATLHSETTKFLDWNHSKGKTSHDWQATWRLWISRCDPPEKSAPPVRLVGRCADCGALEYDCACVA